MSYERKRDMGPLYTCKHNIGSFYSESTSQFLFGQIPDDVNENKYYFDVDLKLPSVQPPCPLARLATYLPSFNQTFEQLDSYMNLDTFDVEGSLGDIYVEVGSFFIVLSADFALFKNYSCLHSLFMPEVSSSRHPQRAFRGLSMLPTKLFWRRYCSMSFDCSLFSRILTRKQTDYSRRFII